MAHDGSAKIDRALAQEEYDGVPLSAVDKVFAMCRESVPFVDYRVEEVWPLQLAAFNERLRQRRAQVPALEQRAKQFGMEAAESADDVAAMLFPSATYKSYPESFLARGEWSNLLRWLDTLSTSRLLSVNFNGCADLDDFVRRVSASGYRVLTSSGTSGKPSLFLESRTDEERSFAMFGRSVGWMMGLDSTSPYVMLFTGYSSNSAGGLSTFDSLELAFARGGRVNLFGEALRAEDLSRLAALNKALANGTASPSEIEAVRQAKAADEARTEQAVERFANELAARAREPMILGPHVWRVFQAMEVLQRRGEHPAFNPDGRIWLSGGVKNNALPADYQEQVARFFGLPIRSMYGQNEIRGVGLECNAGRYHVPPHIMLLLFDETGSNVVNADVKAGVVEGLFGGFDFSVDGRWGGVITNDWLSVNYDPCPCGLSCPSVVSVRRLDALKKDDKVTCSGRVEMYVRPAG
jgi:hypothetical protein